MGGLPPDQDLGQIQFYLDGIWYPEACPENYYNLQTVFSNLKNSVNDLYFPGGSDGEDFGETLLDIAQFDELQVKNLALIETTQLGTGSTDCKIDCLLMLLGFHQAMERVFYSIDYGKHYYEIRLPRGSLSQLFNRLPTIK